MKNRRRKNRDAQCDVFISYRRDGGEMTALYISQELKRRGYRVFYDRENLRAPVRFNERLRDCIHSCTDFVLILSPHALDRCANEDDWVRTEIETALKAGKNIVPVVMSGFEYPASLPDSIAEIRYIQAMTPSMDFFTESMDRLCDDFLLTRLRTAHSWLVPLIAGAALALLALAAILFATGVLPPSSPAVPAPEATPAPTAEPTAEEPAVEPTTEPTAEPTAEPAAEAAAASPVTVLGSLEARMQLALCAGRDGNVLELLDERTTLDMAEFNEGFTFIAPMLELKNPTGEDAAFNLQSYIDGDELSGGRETCPAGETVLCGFDLTSCDPRPYMTLGRHTASYVVNGKELISFDYELTGGKRADPRDNLLVSPMLSVYDEQGNFLRFERGEFVNRRLSPEGVRYGSAIEITNLGEDKEFHLCAYSMDESAWHCEPETVRIAHGETKRFTAFPLPEDADNWAVNWLADGYFLPFGGAFTFVDEDPGIAPGQIKALTLESFLALAAPDGGILECWSEGCAPADKGEYPAGSLYALKLQLQNTVEQDVFFSLSGSLDGREWDRIWGRLAPGESSDFLLGLGTGEQAQAPGRHTLTYRINDGELHAYEYELTDEPRADLRDQLYAQAYFSVLNAQGEPVHDILSSQADLRLLPEEGGYLSPTLMLKNDGEDAVVQIALTDENGRTRLEDGDVCDLLDLPSGENTVYTPNMLLNRPWTRNLVWYVNGYPILEETYTVTGEPAAEPTAEPAAAPIAETEPASPATTLGGLEARARLAMYAPHGGIMELLGDSEILDTAEYPDGSFIAPAIELRNPTDEDIVIYLKRYIDGDEVYSDYASCPAGETVLYGHFDLSQCDPARYMTPGRHTASFAVDGEEPVVFEYELTDGKRADPRDSLAATPMLSVYDAQGNFLRFERGDAVNLRVSPEGVRYGSAIEITNLGEDAQFHLYAQGHDGSEWYEPEPVRIAHGETKRLACLSLPEKTDNWGVFWAADGYGIADVNYVIVDKGPTRASGQVKTLEQCVALAGPDGGMLEAWEDARAPLHEDALLEGRLYAPCFTLNNSGSIDIVFALSGSLDGREWGRIWMLLMPGESRRCFLGLDAAEQAQTPGRHTLTYRINDGEAYTYEYELTD